MGLGPIELIIIGVLCAVPIIVLVATIIILVILVQSASKNKTDHQ